MTSVDPYRQADGEPAGLPPGPDDVHVGFGGLRFVDVGGADVPVRYAMSLVP